MVCRPTGIRTPTDGTKNRSATVTPWVCLYFGGANLKKKFVLNNYFSKIYPKMYFIDFIMFLFSYKFCIFEQINIYK